MPGNVRSQELLVRDNQTEKLRLANVKREEGEKQEQEEKDKAQEEEEEEDEEEEEEEEGRRRKKKEKEKEKKREKKKKQDKPSMQGCSSLRSLVCGHGNNGEFELNSGT